LKPWLLNLLACPIDKHHPLEAHFFRWETKPEEIVKIAAEAGKPKNGLEDKYSILVKQLRDGTISPPALAAIHDHTGSDETTYLLTEALNLLKVKTEREGDIDRLYSYMNSLELGEGLLFCEECGRWYPIGSAVEGVPELMPDELRDEEKDLTWLKKWEKVIPKNIWRIASRLD
jgi:uncharacterized protein YbaR (Trm112 family)